MFQTLRALCGPNVPRLDGAETAHSTVTTPHQFILQKPTQFKSDPTGSLFSFGLNT